MKGFEKVALMARVPPTSRIFRAKRIHEAFVNVHAVKHVSRSCGALTLVRRLELVQARRLSCPNKRNDKRCCWGARPFDCYFPIS